MNFAMWVAALFSSWPGAGALSPVAWPLAPPALRSALESSLKHRLGDVSMQVDLLDFSRRAAIGDAVEFPAGGLMRIGQSASSEEHFWRGRVVLRAERRTVPVWVRARIHAEGPVWVMQREVPAGKQLEIDDAQLELRPLTLTGVPPMIGGANPAGRIARTRLAAGTVLTPSTLAPSPVARRGERVKLQVDRGQAHLEMEAEVVANAFAGQPVTVRIPSTGRRLQGRIDASGKVIVPSPR
jgi:flagella basal body P-ring formation protein FlgA